MNQLNIEQKLDIIRKALEHGARIDLNIHKVIGEEKAKEIIAEIVEDTDLGYELENNRRWFHQEDRLSDVNVTVYFELNKDEKIAKAQEELSGYMEEDVFLEDAN